MSPMSRLTPVQGRDVDHAYAKIRDSEDKFNQTLQERKDLSKQIDECASDMEHYAKQLHYQRYSTTQEKVRLQDKHHLARKHLSYLEEQHERAVDRMNSAQAVFYRHCDDHEKLKNLRYEQMEMERDIRERERKEYVEARHRRCQSSRTFDHDEEPRTWTRIYYFVCEPEENTHRYQTRSRSPRHHYQTDHSRPRSRSERVHREPSGQTHPPRSSSRPSRSPLNDRMPSEETITSWRRYVSDCFTDYSKIVEFPHPPVPGRRDDPKSWEKGVRRLFRSLDGINLRKESFRWHPDKFSPCDNSKREIFQKYAKDVYVILNAMVQEEK